MPVTVVYRGRPVPRAELAKQLGLTREALRSRIRKGWPEERWAEPMGQPAKDRPKCLTCGSPVERNPAACIDGRGKYCSLRCRPPNRAKHGHNRAKRERSPTYKVWHGMKQRCLNPNHRNYHRYGGRGIQVCEGWLGFKGFLADMGERPEGLTIDRIDSDGNYEPGNCRWATMKQQCNNWGGTRNTRVAYQGREYTLQELADKLDLNRYTLRQRIFEMQWPEEHWAERPSKTKRH